MGQGIDAMRIAGIELPEAEIAAICRRHQVRPDSDIDFLVDFLPGARPGLLGVAAPSRSKSTAFSDGPRA